MCYSKYRGAIEEPGPGSSLRNDTNLDNLNYPFRLLAQISL